MIQRYSRPAMRELWTEENKLRIWLQIESLASEALVKEGIVPQADFLVLKTGLETCAKDPKSLAERARELEKTLNHDVIAFTTAVAEKVNHPASRWLHFGLTSSDVIDTAVYDAAPNLKVVSIFAAGYENIDLNAATRRKIVGSAWETPWCLAKINPGSG